MCAIAALASCSQNDDEISGGSNAPEAKVTIQFAGSEAATRAGTIIGDNDAVVNTLSAFFFDKNNKIINGEVPVNLQQVDPQKRVTLNTTTDATQVILVANAPEKTSYAGITTTDLLKNKVISLLGTTDGGGNTPITQTATNLTMSGWGTITMTEQTGEATVALHFIAAKISAINFSFTDAESMRHYATDESDLSTNSATKWFYIKQAYLMTAQTNSTLMPSGATTTLWDGAFGPTSDFAYTGGKAWGEGPWMPARSAYKVSSDYLNNPVTATSATTGSVGNVLGSKAFYVFENNTTEANDATAVVVEARCNIKGADNITITQESRYFTVYFGEKKTGGNFPNIKGGENYTIALTAKNSFDPAKGTGGGGTPDPTKPTIPAAVTVTVKPASWTPNLDIKKDFN